MSAAKFVGRSSILAIALAGCSGTPGEEQGPRVATSREAVHTGEPHTGNEPAIFDMTAPLCANFFGDISRGFADDMLPPDPANTAAGTMFLESVVKESVQELGGGYTRPGFGPPIGGSGNPELPPLAEAPTAACVAEHPGSERNFEVMRQRIVCSCIVDSCKDKPTEAEQIQCTAETGFLYRDCLFEHTTCDQYFIVDTWATGAFLDEAFTKPMPEAEIGVYYNDLTEPVACGHEHGASYIFIRPSPGSNWGYMGSYAQGSNGAGSGHLGCEWIEADQFGFKVPPVKVHGRGIRAPGGAFARPGGLRILAAAFSHTTHATACGYFGCNHPVGVRVDYSVPPLMASADEADQFWVEPNQTPLPSDERATLGEHSQVVPRVGQNVFVSRPLGSTDEPIVGDSAFIDVFIPDEQTNPDSVGSIELRVEIPSAGISERVLGARELTDLPRETWSGLEFALGADVRNALRTFGDDARFKLTVTLTSIAAPTLIDNFRFSGNLDIVGQSPVARCHDVNLSVGPACAPVAVTAAMVDAGSSDPNGDPLTFELSPPGPFGVGTSTVTLRVTDGSLASRCEARVVVSDSSPPSLSVPTNVSVKSCTDKTTVAVGQATATDNCGPITPTGAVIASNGVTLTTPIPVLSGQVQLAPGVHTVQWTATDGASSTQRTQTVRVSPAIETRESFLVSDRGVIRQASGAGAAVLNSGTGATRLGYDARAGGIFSVGAVELLDRAILDAGITSAGSISVSSSATVPGPVAAFSRVLLPALPALPTFPAPVGGDQTVNSGSTLNLSPGSRPSLTVSSGGTLILGAGDYYFRNLTVFANATVRAQTTTRVFVRDTLVVQSPFRTPTGTTVQSLFLGFAGSTLSLEAVFNGTLLAPNASVSFGIGSGLTFTGAFYGRVFQVRPQSTLVCVAGSAIALP